MGSPGVTFIFKELNVLNVEFGSGRVYSIAVATVLPSIINSVKSVGSLNLFSNTVTSYPDMTSADESFLGGQSEYFSVWRNIVLRREPWLLAGEAEETIFHALFILRDDIWRRETYSFSVAFNCGLLHLFHLLVSIGWARGALCHRMCLRWHIC